jgi:hypothetical protein
LINSSPPVPTPFSPRENMPPHHLHNPRHAPLCGRHPHAVKFRSRWGEIDS